MMWKGVRINKHQALHDCSKQGRMQQYAVLPLIYFEEQCVATPAGKWVPSV